MRVLHFCHDAVNLLLEIVIQSQFTQSALNLFNLLLRQSALGIALDLHIQTEIVSYTQLRQNLRIEIHPLL